MTLRKRTMSAGRWTAASALGRVGFQILQVAIVARVLAPADIGLMAIVVAVLAVLALLAEFGLGRATIHYDDIDADTLSSLYWLNVCLAIVLAFAMAACAPLLARLYDKPALLQVLVAMSPILVVQALGQQFAVLAEKELRLAALAQNEIIAAAAGFAACVGLAVFARAGVYALVGGAFASAAVLTALAWVRLSHAHRPRWHLRFSETRPFLRYGGYLVAENFAGALIRQCDVFVGGAIVSSASLGIYSLPRDLALRIGTTINQIATRVGFPVMARLKHDATALSDVYLQSLRMSASVNFPIYAAIAVFADELINLLYGPRFVTAAPLLPLLAAWGAVRSIGNPVGALLYAVGKTRRAFWWNVTQLAIAPMFYWAGVNTRGITGLAIAMVVVQLLLFVPMWWWLVRRCISVSFVDYMRPIVPPLIASVVAGATAYFATLSLAHGTARLAVGVAIGAMVYCGLSALINRRWWHAMVELVSPTLSWGRR